MQKNEPEREITVRDLYPDLSEEELLVAERNLDRYIELVILMYERRFGSASLTVPDKDHRIEPASYPEEPSKPS